MLSSVPSTCESFSFLRGDSTESWSSMIRAITVTFNHWIGRFKSGKGEFSRAKISHLSSKTLVVRPEIMPYDVQPSGPPTFSVIKPLEGIVIMRGNDGGQSEIGKGHCGPNTFERLT